MKKYFLLLLTTLFYCILFCFGNKIDRYAAINKVALDTTGADLFVDTSLVFTDLRAMYKYGSRHSTDIFNYAKRISEKIIDENQKRFVFDSLVLRNQDLYTVLLVKSLKKSEKSLDAMRLLIYNLDFSRMVTIQDRINLFNMYPPNVRNSIDGKRILAHLNVFNSTNGVEKSSAFKKALLKTMNGRTLSLSSIVAGKSFNYYILIFGASWCSPCRYENILLNKLINRIDTSKIKIIGISIDDSESAWKNAIRQDGCKWENFLLIGGKESSLYTENVTRGIPYNMLIGRDGKIIQNHGEIRIVLDALPPSIYKKPGTTN